MAVNCFKILTSFCLFVIILPGILKHTDARVMKREIGNNWEIVGQQFEQQPSIKYIDQWAFEKNTKFYPTFTQNDRQLERKAGSVSSCTFAKPISEYKCRLKYNSTVLTQSLFYYSAYDPLLGVGQLLNGNVIYNYSKFNVTEEKTTVTAAHSDDWSIIYSEGFAEDDNRLREGSDGCVNLDAIFHYAGFCLKSGSERWVPCPHYDSGSYSTIRLLKLNCVREQLGAVPFAEAYWALCADQSCNTKQRLIINGASTDRYVFYFRFHNGQPPPNDMEDKYSDFGKECYGPADPLRPCNLTGLYR